MQIENVFSQLPQVTTDRLVLLRVYAKGTFHDVMVWAILRDDWACGR